LIEDIEKLMNKVNKVKKLAEGGRYICKDEMAKNTFELIIRELGNFQQWQKENAREPKTGE